MLKDNTVVEVNIEEPGKAKAGSEKPKTMEAASMSTDGQPVQAAMEVRLEKVWTTEGKCWNRSVRSWNWEDGSGNILVREEYEAIPSNDNGGIANELAPMQSSLPFTWQEAA